MEIREEKKEKKFVVLKDNFLKINKELLIKKLLIIKYKGKGNLKNFVKRRVLTCSREHLLLFKEDCRGIFWMKERYIEVDFFKK